MPEITQMTFTHRELVEILIRKQDLHEGIWGLFIKFGLASTNIGPTPTEIMPAAMLGVLEIGLQKQDQESSIALDAAKVNPSDSSDSQKTPLAYLFNTKRAINLPDK